MGCLTESRGRGGKQEWRGGGGGRGEFAVVAHDIICFVEGGSRGHSERRKRLMFVFLRGSVCGIEGPVSREEETAGRQTDGQTDRQTGERTRGDGKEGRG